MKTLEKLSSGKTCFRYRMPLLLLMLLFMASSVLAVETVYVDLNSPTDGQGSSANPYNNVGSAVWVTNELYSETSVVIYVRGTTQGPIFMTFNERKDSTTISVQAWPGHSFVINNNNATEGTNVGISIVLNKFAEFTLSGVTVTGGYYENYGILIDVKNRNQPTVVVENCNFSNISWTTNAAIADSPPNYDSYLYPLYLIDEATQGFGLNNNTFTNVAVGYGHLIGRASRDGSGFSNSYISLETTGFYNGNTATGTILPFSAATATEFYVDGSVAAGESGLGGNGSKSNPWKYLTSGNFGAIFKDWSTDPATPIEKDVTVYFEAGTHMLQNAIYMEGITSGSSLTLKPAPGAEGQVILDGSGIAGQWESIIACNNCNNVTIQGLKLKNLTCDQSYDMDTRFGIIFNGSGNNINILDNEVSDMHWSNNATDKLNPKPTNNLGAIQVIGTQSTPITNVLINGNNVHDITPGWTEAITVNGNVDGFTISNNTVTNIANIGIVAAGNYAWVPEQAGATVTAANNYSKNGTISGNSATYCISPIAISAGIYVDGAQNITVTNNTSSFNGTGVSIGHEQHDGTSGGHTVSGNTFISNIDAGMYIGSTNTTSMVENVEISGNICTNNYNDDAGMLAKANGSYGGGEKSGEVKIYRITDLNFSDNTVTSQSDVVMVKDFYGLHVGNHTYNNNTYTTASNNPNTAQFIYADSGNTASWTPLSFCQHQGEGFDVNSTLGSGDCDANPVGGIYNTSEITITELSPMTSHEIIELSTENSEVEIDEYHTLTELHPDLTNKGYSIVHALDDYKVESSTDEIHFLAPASYGTDGFPATHPVHGFTNVEVVLQRAASVYVYDGNTTEVQVYDLYKRGNFTEVALEVPTKSHDSGDTLHDHNDFIILSHRVSSYFWQTVDTVNVYLDEAFGLTEHAIKLYEDVSHQWSCSARALKRKDLLILSECLMDQSIQNYSVQVVLKAGNRFVLELPSWAIDDIKELLPWYTFVKKLKDPIANCVGNFVDDSGNGGPDGDTACTTSYVRELVVIGVMGRSMMEANFIDPDTEVIFDLDFSTYFPAAAGLLAAGMVVHGLTSGGGTTEGCSAALVENTEIASPVFVGGDANPDVYKYPNDPVSGELKDIMTARPYVVSVSTAESSYILPLLSSVSNENATTNIVWENDESSSLCRMVVKETNTSNDNSSLPMIIGIQSYDLQTYLNRGWSLVKNNAERTVSIESPLSDDTTLLLMEYVTGITNPFIEGIGAGVHVWGTENLRTYVNMTDVTSDPWTINSTGKHAIGTGDSAIFENNSATMPNDFNIHSDSNARLYPNPVKDKIIIELENNKSAQIEIYNLQGVKIKELPYGQGDTNGVEVNLSAYQTGLYFVRIVTDGNTYVQKILKE